MLWVALRNLLPTALIIVGNLLVDRLLVEKAYQLELNVNTTLIVLSLAFVLDDITI